MDEALRRQSERLRLLWEAATVLLTTDDPDAMLRSLFAKIAPHFGLDAYFNFLVSESGDPLLLASCVGVPEETARAISRLEFGQAVRFEYPHQTADGTRWVSAIVYCIERLPGGRCRCSYMAEDVTEKM